MSVIVITGGSRGIGASAARHIAGQGMGVILTYNNNPEAADEVVAGIEQAGGKAVALKLDVAVIGGFAAFREAVVAILGEVWGVSSLGGLVNNAGYGLFNPLDSVSEAQFDGLFNVHLKGPFFLTQTLLPLLEENASIVNLTSATTRVATAGVAPYAAFKGGLEVLTRYMAKEFGERRVRVNAVSPGAIRTELRKRHLVGSGSRRMLHASLRCCCRRRAPGSMPRPSKSQAATTSERARILTCWIISFCR